MPIAEAETPSHACEAAAKGPFKCGPCACDEDDGHLGKTNGGDELTASEKKVYMKWADEFGWGRAVRDERD